jgi:hypothetical protein
VKEFPFCGENMVMILVYRNVVGHIHGLTLVAALDQIVYMHFAASSYLTYAVPVFSFRIQCKDEKL